mmetsp:Transcript_32975/g.53499  ORF Transcript_32975/g.53499 Transcript_32975/m.53499 type:complete len:311 (-) Transcript_32975:755-1687(-)
MDGRKGSYGSVGAVSGVKNPIVIAEALLRQEAKGLLSARRVPPMMLVGDGARRWAQKQGLGGVSADPPLADFLVTNMAKMQWQNAWELVKQADSKSKSRGTKRCGDDVSGLGPASGSKRAKGDADGVAKNDEEEAVRLDTVGAICCDSEGNMAAGVSSGGILLKTSGRVGQAAVYGAGVWAQNPSPVEAGVACSTTGTGEYLIKAQLAKEFARRASKSDATAYDACTSAIMEEFMTPVDIRHGGLIGMRAEALENTVDVELVWAHTTKSMAVGYMDGNGEKTVTISRLTDPESHGRSLQTSGARVRLPKQ